MGFKVVLNTKKIYRKSSLFRLKICLFRHSTIGRVNIKCIEARLLDQLIIEKYSSLPQIITVSFFGASHVIMPLQEAKLSTNIRLKFRSRQENAMIFLTAGRTDHCLLTISEGRIKFNLKIEDYETEVSLVD